jgi:hypothetical protein
LTTNHNIGGSWVFKINIDPVNALVLHVSNDICSKGVAGVDNGFSNDAVGRRLDRVSPATQQQDALHVRQFFEVLLLLCIVIDDGLPSFGLDVAESSVHVCVAILRICAPRLHVQAFTPEIVRLVVYNALECCWCARVLLDLVAAIGNTGVLEVLQLGPCATTFGRRKSQ